MGTRTLTLKVCPRWPQDVYLAGLPATWAHRLLTHRNSFVTVDEKVPPQLPGHPLLWPVSILSSGICARRVVKCFLLILT